MSARPPSPLTDTLRGWLFTAMLALLCGAAALSAQAATDPAKPATAQGPQVGDLPPDWLGLDRDGKSIRVSQYRGKVVLVVFWAGWCEQCRRELPQLSALQTGFGRERLQIVAINYAEPQRDYEAFLRLNPGLDLLTLRDPGTVARYYRVRAVPNAFLIDTRGRIAHVQRGYTPEKVERLVRELHALLPPAAATAGRD
ncbi:TlpA disulfide reductase family protein [Lysobacter sp. cf310]|uniref:TlpA disulfide reductase family protein n=1 Tax=Lysobacter sp. cf310 TaxID=1761790 RepID=UPI0008EA6773|nr:TlpA disulfide reductase family protein [Lysobacter sp. cf310]SFK66357.1 Thiol-disulfide isomerase or thioredoxin [Lysobacter sp. cf310]